MYDAALPGMLAKVQVPTLLVWGADDRIMPLECGHLFQQALPNAQLRIVEGCGHFVHLDRPHELANTISEFTS
jgi:pimeloyl-ACP methyl ester carboxylesterase